MKLNEQISALRKGKKMSQEALAAAMNVSRQAVSKWENGQSNPDTENLIRLAEIFQVDVNLLVRDNAEEAGTSPHAPRPGVPVIIVWLLGILVGIAIAAAVIFACLWQEEVQMNRVETVVPSSAPVETYFDNVKMYHGLGQEVSLTQQEQTDLIKYIQHFHYTKGTAFDRKDENGQTLYGGRQYIVEYTQDGTAYHWCFTEQGFHHTITYPDGEKLEFYYSVDYVLFYELDRYIY